MTLTTKTTLEFQRRQLAITDGPNGISVTLRWDYNTLKYSDAFAGWTIDQVKRTMGLTQLGREPHEINWTFNTVAGVTVWYSDVFVCLQGGIKPTPEQLALFMQAKPKIEPKVPLQRSKRC